MLDVVSMNTEGEYAWTGASGMDGAPVAYHHLPYAPGGNIGMWRDVFEELAGFDEDLLRAEDVDFGWRASYLGVPVHFEPRAVLHRRLHTTPARLFRASIRGGVAEAALFHRHRARGMPRPTTREVVEIYRWLLTAVPDVVAGRADRHCWAHHLGKRLGRVAGSVRHRVRYL